MRLDGAGLVLGLVADQHALVVAQDDGVVRGRHEIVRHERNLAAAVRAVDHVGRNAQAGHVAAQPFHDLQPLPDRGAEMAGPDDRIAVEEVIGPDLDAQQGPHQFAHGLQVVVDPLEQHRVVVDRHAGLEQALAHAGRFRRDLARMVEVRLNPDLLRRGQQVDQVLDRRASAAG